MRWHQLRRPHVLRIRGLLEERYQAATANRRLAALRGVLGECWQAELITIENYQAAISIPPSAVSQNRAAAISLPASCEASSRPAAVRLNEALVFLAPAP
jgi:hypothetical protein